MKHPDTGVESFAFNLGKAPELRCMAGAQQTTCGACEGCCLITKISSLRSWFRRAGDQSQRRFVLGLIRRLHSVDLIQYVINLLQPLLCKDYTYARARTNPSLRTDHATMSADRALNVTDLETCLAETWFWFQNANYWTKRNFILVVMQDCETHLLYLLGMQAKTLLVSEERAFDPKDDYESASLTESSYSYDTADHPELDLLSTACSEYSTIQRDPLSASVHGERSWDGERSEIQSRARTAYSNEDEIVNDDSGDDSEEDKSSSVDPTCMVIPTSSKAYSGVSKFRDFIRCLPVHISKMILGFMDSVSLYNCVCVSRNWRVLAEEVHRESFVQQHIREEVMLMQGAAAQGCNPVYAKDMDVAVPNLQPNSWTTIKTGSEVQTMFKSEISFTTAYSGYSTRKIIMEERNVYCGAYNVMVLLDQPDLNRIVNTDGGKLIAIGSTDRKVRFIHSETGHEVEPLISGHAGSIRCVALNEKQQFVLSGSYDTSIRKWSLETGKCQKIFRGHRDTIICLKLVGEMLVSGSRDKTCKVWVLETGKCIRTFKHKNPVTAVCLGREPPLCISGCDAGQVKVWHMRSGDLIKTLMGHHGSVTAIRFDRWHIVTGSKDGYALAWSSQGDHSRCLTALRHPKEVMCLEMMYLRVITGSADGKLRIWNMVTGQCLRIMRGNSRSDPIHDLIAIGNRITINTSNNLLVLNFEPVEFDYTLENDKMPPLVQYSKYSDAPVRLHPYPYVRAQRMKKAGAANTKIVHHEGKDQPVVYRRMVKKPDQIPHSAKILSERHMENARRIQSASARLERNRVLSAEGSSRKDHSQGYDKTTAGSKEDAGSFKKSASVKSVSVHGKPPAGRGAQAKSRAGYSTTKTGTHSVVSVGGFQIGRGDDDSDVADDTHGDLRRRVSWAFERPFAPKSKELSLSETKALLRSQIRARGEVVPPDFIYLSVNAIHANMKPSEASKNMESNRREQEMQLNKKMGRPSSSPSRVDPRTKVPMEELEWDQLILEHGLGSHDAEAKSMAESHISPSVKSVRSHHTSTTTGPPIVTKTVIIKEFAPKAVDAKPHMSLHSAKVPSSIPKPLLVRPHTAKVRRSTIPSSQDSAMRRVKSASAGMRPDTGTTGISNVSSDFLSETTGPRQGIRTSTAEVSMVPMLMHSRELKEKLEGLKQFRAQRQSESLQQLQADPASHQPGVSKFNGPMRDHVEFRLLTHAQVQEQMQAISNSYVDDKTRKHRLKERRKKAAWLAKVKGHTDKDFSRRPNFRAPELHEFTEVGAVS